MQGEMEDKCGIVGIHCTDESKNVALAIQDRMLTDDLSVELPVPA